MTKKKNKNFKKDPLEKKKKLFVYWYVHSHICPFHPTFKKDPLGKKKLLLL